MAIVTVPTTYYQHFDCDFGRDVPTEGFGGWKQADLPVDLDRTAVVLMHAWECGTRDRYPGWHRCAEWIPRAQEICRTVFPGLLAAVRASPLKLFHVVSSGTYYHELPGYRATVELAGPEPAQPERLPERLPEEPVAAGLRRFRAENVFVGRHNEADVARGFAALDFAPEARPAEGEPVAQTSHQLFALCRQAGVSHLIYAGFAIDGCLLLSPGGMVDMSRRGILCSAFRQAVTAIENKETARGELLKEAALWRVALLYGFVYDVQSFVRAIGAAAVESLPGRPGLTFSGRIGRTYPAATFPKGDLLLDTRRYDSEGYWAFCRFSSPEVPALRMGFQLGGFNIGTSDRAPDPDLLQLHLEVMGREGGRLWLPTGSYPASAVTNDPDSLDLRLERGGQEVFRVRGWPEMDWHFRSEDGELEATLRVAIDTVTILPDCLLPRCVFSMWETMGAARGTVRNGAREVPVEGKVFFDHPRIEHELRRVSPRAMYLYTTLSFEDGSGLFGYHAVDDQGRPIPYYCFGVYVDAAGRGSFLPEARTPMLQIGADRMPTRWSLEWKGSDVTVRADIEVRDLPLVRAWGSPSAPRQRRDFTVYPLVLDGKASIGAAGRTRDLLGRGLAEYYNAEHWPA